jgi:hypothetical protein
VGTLDERQKSLNPASSQIFNSSKGVEWLVT